MGYRFLDVFHRNLPVLNGQKITQGLACQLDRDVFVVEARISQNFSQRTFQLAHIGANVLGDEKCHLLRHGGLFGFGLAQQDGHAHFQLRRLNGHCQTGIKTRHQAFVDVGQSLGIGITGHHDV